MKTSLEIGPSVPDEELTYETFERDRVVVYQLPFLCVLRERTSSRGHDSRDGADHELSALGTA